MNQGAQETQAKFKNRLLLALLLLGLIALLRPAGKSQAHSHTVDALDPVMYFPVITKGFNPAMEYEFAHIDAEVGGSVTLGQATLSIPAGALREDTTISIARPINGMDVGDRGVGYLKFEPSWLTFTVPAVLSIEYIEPLIFEEEWLIAYTYSRAESRWERLDVVSRDTTNNWAVFGLDHFSLVTTIFDRPLDLAVHIPGEYLKKGDLIYSLSVTEGITTFAWLPGHVALYLGSPDPGAGLRENDGQTLIESAPGSFNYRQGCDDGGVRLGDWTDFVAADGFLYLGARRLPDMSGEKRIDIAAYALSKLERGYSRVGQGNLGDNCYSSVGLTEAAYDAAGQSIVPDNLAVLPILPLEQYVRTRPIDEITAQSGDPITLSVKRVYWSDSQEQYVADSMVVISGCPTGAVCAGGDIRWIPTSAHVGDHTLHFRSSVTTGSETYRVSQLLTIHVVVTGTGTISGEVIDAATGVGIAGATVSVDGTDLSTSTGTDGSFMLSDVPAGSHTVTAGKSGYVEISRDDTVFDGQTTTSNFALPSAANPNDVVVTLTWEQDPHDLDAHLWLPSANPFHVGWPTWGSLSSFPYAQLDIDAYSFGPENITVRQQFDGIYTYAVYSWSEPPDMTTSSARVTVVQNGVLVLTYAVPRVGSGQWWHVFDYDVTAGHLIPRDYLTDTAPRADGP